MKVIFSRKGFDSASGGMPSPILPDGTLCSFPIPSNQSPTYGEIRFGATTIGELYEQLSGKRGVSEDGTHFDHDLRKDALRRKKDWRPCFGQVGAAQTHLENEKVYEGDLFLFFGWFRHTMVKDDELRFGSGASGIHAIFGWLQVGEMLHLGKGGSKIPRWGSEHPHVVDSANWNSESTNDTLYVARNRMSMRKLSRLPGGGMFNTFDKKLQLTAEGENRSIWRLPGWMIPTKGKPPLSYHADKTRWNKCGSDVLLKTVGRGQEFVLDCDYYPEAIDWLHELFSCSYWH